RRDPASLRTAVEISALLIGVSSHVSQFLVRLFGIEKENADLAIRTMNQDPIFRFKVDFVRRRVLPSLKRISIPDSISELDSSIELLRASTSEDRKLQADPELATALAAAELLDAERAFSEKGNADEREKASQFLSRLGGSASAEAVKIWVDRLSQWCAAHLRDPEYKGWVSFRFPDTVDHFDLVHVQRLVPGLPESMTGPDATLRRRDGFVLTDKRMGSREV